MNKYLKLFYILFLFINLNLYNMELDISYNTFEKASRANCSSLEMSYLELNYYLENIRSKDSNQNTLLFLATLSALCTGWHILHDTMFNDKPMTLKEKRVIVTLIILGILLSCSIYADGFDILGNCFKTIVPIDFCSQLKKCLESSFFKSLLENYKFKTNLYTLALNSLNSLHLSNFLYKSKKLNSLTLTQKKPINLTKIMLNEPELSCNICLNEIDQNNLNNYVNSCLVATHIFCKPCVKDWISKSRQEYKCMKCFNKDGDSQNKKLEIVLKKKLNREFICNKKLYITALVILMIINLSCCFNLITS